MNQRIDPVIDDWDFDYEKILTENEVQVEWSDIVVDNEGHEFHEPSIAGWGFLWKYDAIHIGKTTEEFARKGAALFISLWLRGFSASLCCRLMEGWISHLELQEQPPRLTLYRDETKRLYQLLAGEIKTNGDPKIQILYQLFLNYLRQTEPT